MAGTKVRSSVFSTATQRVFASLYEKELEYELVPVDLKAGEPKKNAFLSLNPFGQVPVLEHGAQKLFETRAITQYIAQAFPDKGTQLTCPGKPIAPLLVWKEVEALQFDPPSSKLNWELVFKPMFGMTTDPAVVEENEAKLAQVLDVYEARLSQSKYLACDCFTLVDLHHLPNINLLLGTPVKKLFDARPHVSAWAADITSRPTWAAVLALLKHGTPARR